MPSRSSNNVLPITGATKTHHFSGKFVAAAVSGEYVNVSNVLTSLSILRSTHSDEGMLRLLSGDLITITRPQRKRLVDSLDIWLQVWTKNEMKVVSSGPECYLELAAYCKQFQLANRKFCWPSVYMFHVQPHIKVASPAQPSRTFYEMTVHRKEIMKFLLS